MIDLGPFFYAAPPRCGTTWVINAAVAVGLKEGFKATVHLPPENSTKKKLLITTVRHPCDWLVSYWTSIYPGKIGVPAVDRFADLPIDFDDFIRLYLTRMPGYVSKMFLIYRADSYIRLEDLPQAFHDVLGSYDIEQRDRCLTIPKQNFNRKEFPLWNPSLYDRVLDSEAEAMERFEYGRYSCHYSSEVEQLPFWKQSVD
jgi:hypothetical protein